jgi:hypothetical protein
VRKAEKKRLAGKLELAKKSCKSLKKAAAHMEIEFKKID